MHIFRLYLYVTILLCAYVCVFAEQLATVGRDLFSRQQLRGVRAVAASLLAPARPRRPSPDSDLLTRLRWRRRSSARAPCRPPTRRRRWAVVTGVEPQPLNALVAQLDTRLHTGCATLSSPSRHCRLERLQLHEFNIIHFQYTHLHAVRSDADLAGERALERTPRASECALEPPPALVSSHLSSYAPKLIFFQIRLYYIIFCTLLILRK